MGLPIPKNILFFIVLAGLFLFIVYGEIGLGTIYSIETFNWKNTNWELKNTHTSLLTDNQKEMGDVNIFTHTDSMRGKIFMTDARIGRNGIATKVSSQNLNLDFSKIEKVNIIFIAKTEIICDGTGKNAGMNMVLKKGLLGETIFNVNNGCGQLTQTSSNLELKQVSGDKWNSKYSIIPEPHWSTPSEKVVMLSGGNYELEIIADGSDCGNTGNSCLIDYEIKDIVVKYKAGQEPLPSSTTTTTTAPTTSDSTTQTSMIDKPFYLRWIDSLSQFVEQIVNYIWGLF